MYVEFSSVENLFDQWPEIKNESKFGKMVLGLPLVRFMKHQP